MAVKKMQYQNLNHALKLFKMQVLEGIPYAQNNCPKFETAEQIFDWLKLRTKYKNDPQGTELFQTLPTLLENNFHGITGHGDCDCFSIAACTLLAANNFKNFGIVLVGRNSYNPVHIYCYYIDENGNKFYLDLTNKYYNQTRTYLYKQEIPFNLTQTDKNNMLLQLADMAAPRRGRRPRPTHAQIEKYKQSSVYKRKRAAFLKRQQENQAHAQMVRAGQRLRPNRNHVYLPSKGVQIREDYFDNRLSNGEFQHMLLSEGYELNEIEELAGRRGDRRRAKKDEKRQLKKEKKQSKVELRKARAEKKRAAGEAKRIKAQAKQDKANRGGGDDDESEAESTAGRIFGKVIGGAKQAIGVYKSARGGGDEESSDDTGGGESTGAGSPTVRTSKDETPPKTINIFGKEIKQSTAIIAGVVTLAAVAGTVIAVKNRNKRAAKAA